MSRSAHARDAVVTQCQAIAVACVRTAAKSMPCWEGRHRERDTMVRRRSNPDGARPTGPNGHARDASPTPYPSGRDAARSRRALSRGARPQARSCMWSHTQLTRAPSQLWSQTRLQSHQGALHAPCPYCPYPSAGKRTPSCWRIRSITERPASDMCSKRAASARSPAQARAKSASSPASREPA